MQNGSASRHDAALSVLFRFEMVRNNLMFSWPDKLSQPCCFLFQLYLVGVLYAYFHLVGVFFVLVE